jgi:hypothetical protein
MLFRREFDPAIAVQLHSTLLPQFLHRAFETVRRHKGGSTDVETLIACAKITKSVIADGLENDFVNGCGSLCFGVASLLSRRQCHLTDRVPRAGLPVWLVYLLAREVMPGRARANADPPRVRLSVNSEQ